MDGIAVSKIYYIKLLYYKFISSKIYYCTPFSSELLSLLLLATTLIWGNKKTMVFLKNASNCLTDSLTPVASNYLNSGVTGM